MHGIRETSLVTGRTLVDLEVTTKRIRTRYVLRNPHIMSKSVWVHLNQPGCELCM